jgi:DNA-binding LytR/AlgR family response regulator
MILKLEQDSTQKDIEVIIKYPQKNKIVEQIASLVKSFNTQIPCYSDDATKFVNASDIYFIESVDKKTVVCCENENYQVKDRLYQIYEKLKNFGFIRINKYCILNIDKLDNIKTLANSHLEAVLTNGKCLYVTRNYLANIKQILLEN